MSPLLNQKNSTGVKNLVGELASSLTNAPLATKPGRAKLRGYRIDWENIDDAKCIEMTR